MTTQLLLSLLYYALAITAQSQNPADIGRDRVHTAIGNITVSNYAPLITSCFRAQCTCLKIDRRQVSNKINVTCEHLSQESSGTFDFSSETVGHSIDYFSIKNNKNLKYLPANIFASMSSISTLHIEANELNEIIIPESIKSIRKLIVSREDLSVPFNLNYRAGTVLELKEIEFTDVNLTELNNEWSNVTLVSLISLNLNKNSIHRVALDAFMNLPNLKRVSLKSNSLANEFDQRPFALLKNRLERLVLASNRLTSLPSEFENFERLMHLDLSSNLIEAISSEVTFRLLGKLNYLNLGNNRIKFINDNAFSHLKNLFFLLLDHNSLSQIPHVRDLHLLINFNLSAQHAKLVEVGDFQFSREFDASDQILPLSLSLSGDEALRLAPRAFCTNSPSATPNIDVLEVSWSVFYEQIYSPPQRQCIMSQFKFRNLTTTTLILRNVNVNNGKKICDCEFFSFTNTFNLNVVGLECDIQLLRNKCNNSQIIECNYSSNYSCVSNSAQIVDKISNIYLITFFLLVAK